MTSLKNNLLIAMPNLHDATFNRTVTVVCMNDSKGSFGLTINRPIDIPFADVFEQLNLSSDDNNLNKQNVLLGGPVEAGQGFILHDGESRWQNTMAVSDTLSITSSRDILEDITLGDGPENFLLTLGCANWAPQQLEEELMSNAWLTCPVDSRILFDLDYDKRWEAAAESIGVDLNRLSYQIGHD
ncbi:MAG TPA: YqgE/AlgH family protein [Leucothrix mucor]|nr:YqgE/AlgH family protein [Leucothrix mucor]